MFGVLWEPAVETSCTTLSLRAHDTCASCRINGTDIKDKTELIEARKKVEREMERFKVRWRWSLW